MTTARFRLTSVFVVVARWSTDLNVRGGGGTSLLQGCLEICVAVTRKVKERVPHDPE